MVVIDLDSQLNPGRVIPANCDEIYSRGGTENGAYLIQPFLEVEAFEVTCNFEKNPVLTIIAHDKPEKGNGDTRSKRRMQS